MRRGLPWVAALAALSACSGPLPISVHDDRAEPAELDQASGLPVSVAEGCAILGIDCVADPGAPIVLQLFPLGLVGELDHRTSGRILLVARCGRAGWVVDRAASAAHEIGHALGLADVEDPGNVMHWRHVEDTAHVLSAGQADALEAEAAGLLGC
jgi:hypothetical protein